MHRAATHVIPSSLSGQASALITLEILGKEEEHPSPCPKLLLLSGNDSGSIATSQDSHSKYYLGPVPSTQETFKACWEKTHISILDQKRTPKPSCAFILLTSRQT